MKPPRIFPKAGYFWMELWFPHLKNQVRRSTHIPLDIEPPEVREPLWWHSSKKRKKISEAIETFEFERTRERLGLPNSHIFSTAPRTKQIISFAPLLAEMNNDALADRSKLAKQTIRRREHSVGQIEKYDPKAHALNTDRAWVGGFRSWMHDREYSDWTQYTILTDLRKLLEFAKSRGYITDHPFGKKSQKKIELRQPATRVEHTSLDTEFVFFRSLYALHPHAFLIVITERLTGFRNSDILVMKREAISLKEKTFLRTRNVKLQRDEFFPVPDALMTIYQNMSDHLGLDYAFQHITYEAVRKCIIHACENAGIERLRTHQFKKNYAGDLEANNISGLQHIFDFLMHHQTRSTAGKHYTGQNIELMRKTLNTAQKEWIVFAKSIFQKHGQNRYRTRTKHGHSKKIALSETEKGIFGS